MATLPKESCTSDKTLSLTVLGEESAQHLRSPRKSFRELRFRFSPSNGRHSQIIHRGARGENANARLPPEQESPGDRWIDKSRTGENFGLMEDREIISLRQDLHTKYV